MEAVGEDNCNDARRGHRWEEGAETHDPSLCAKGRGVNPLSIGKGVTIGHRAIAHACTIGDYCLLGMGAIIMDDAILEDFVMLGAGSLVPSGKILESGHLYVGSPAKLVRPLKDSEREFLVYSSQHYVALKNQYLT